MRRRISGRIPKVVILDFFRREADRQLGESFNGRFREECLNVRLVRIPEGSQQKIDGFQRDYRE